MWYHLRQNNSHGIWRSDVNKGISTTLIIEADSVDYANVRAQAIGIVFGDYDSCNCCGDRWTELSPYDEPTEVPQAYDKIITPDYVIPLDDFKWMPLGFPEGFVHPLQEPFWGYGYEQEIETGFDGSFGYGATFNKKGAFMYPLGKLGYDETHNYTAPEHKDKAVIKVETRYSYGIAWFPTEQEAKDFVSLFEEVHLIMEETIKATIAEMKGTRKKVARIWMK